MKIGVTLRNMGPQSQPQWMLTGAVHAEATGFESIWITDHIAIPPDDAEGSEGRYLDPLISLAWLAQATSTIRLGTGVLILPYRPALPTAKQIATLAELSADRLELGVGIGWMDPEFRALGVDRHQRGAISDALLSDLRRWFDTEPASANGQPFLFRPKPKRPDIWIGGRPPHALARAVKFGDGWLPMVRSPAQLAPQIQAYRQLQAADTPIRVSVMAGLPEGWRDRPTLASSLAQEYAALGVERLIWAISYRSMDEYQQQLDKLAQLPAMPTS